MHRALTAILAALTLGHIACGGGANDAPTPPAPATDATVPTSLPAPAGPRSGSITGRVTVPAHAQGRPYAAAATAMGQFVSTDVAALTPVAPDGSFTLDYLGPGNYYVVAFVDMNGDGRFTRETEPFVLWPRMVPVDGLTPTTGITLSNFRNLPNPAVRTPERIARVNTLLAEGEAALRELLRADLPDTCDPTRLLPTMRVILANTVEQWEGAATESMWEYVERTLAQLPVWAEAAKRGEDPLAALRGWQQFGFVRPVDNAVIPYLVYIPPDAAPEEPLPLVVALHGGGGTHWTGARLVVGGSTLAQYGPTRSTEVWPPAPPVRTMIVAPIGDRSASLLGWQMLGEVNALGAVDAVTQRYAVDTDRIYLTGISDGGSGSWWIGSRYPDRFAAILVAAGATVGVRPYGINLAHVPMRLVHGSRDTIIPVQQARAMVEMGKSYNANIEYQEVDRDHNVSEDTYGDGVGLKWLLQFRRRPVPPVVRFRTDDIRYNEGAGLLITEAGTPNEFMDAMVTWTDATHVEVTTRNVPALTLRVPAGSGAPISVRWNGQDLQVADRPAAIALRAAAQSGGQVTWSATAVAAPARRPLGPWTGITGGLRR